MCHLFLKESKILNGRKAFLLSNCYCMLQLKCFVTQSCTELLLLFKKDSMVVTRDPHFETLIWGHFCLTSCFAYCLISTERVRKGLWKFAISSLSVISKRLLTVVANAVIRPFFIWDILNFPGHFISHQEVPENIDVSTSENNDAKSTRQTNSTASCFKF